MATVYVVAWEYGEKVPGQSHLSGGGGGFDWFYSAERADDAYRAEKRNCDDPLLAKDNWTAVRYDVEVEADPRLDPVAVTREIEAQDSDLFDKATIRYNAEIGRAEDEAYMLDAEQPD